MGPTENFANVRERLAELIGDLGGRLALST
jgi:hypothetical protein